MDDIRARFVSTLLSACAASVGQREDPPGSNTGPQITKYLRGWRDRYGKQYERGAKWCGLFAEYQIRSAYEAVDGLCPISNAWWLGSSSQWLAMGKKNGWLVEKPEPGDVAVLVDSKNDPIHVCIVRAIDGGLVYSIDGNSADRVKNNARPLGSSVFGSFVRLPVVSARVQSSSPTGPLLPGPSPLPAPPAAGDDPGTPLPGA